MKLAIGITYLVTITTAFPFVGLCAKDIDVNRLADAIKRAENSYSHPYGVMRSYCRAGDPDGQCRKGCLQTIRKRLKMWDGQGDFITYLGSTYCPPSAHYLNKHWVKNVTYFYQNT